MTSGLIHPGWKIEFLCTLPSQFVYNNIIMKIMFQVIKQEQMIRSKLECQRTTHGINNQMQESMKGEKKSCFK